MKIWFDLANSPHVLFFGPIFEELIRQGHRIKVTTREYAQTVPLANKLKILHTTIGQHGGTKLMGLATEIIHRSLQLASWGKNQRFDIAVSHNSYSHAIASFLLQIPVVTIMDYEHQPLNHIAFRLANKVLVPEVFPPKKIIQFGARKKTVFYPGLKEQVYLDDFVPASNFRAQMGLPADISLVVVRPPASWTAYHRFENQLFDLALKTLIDQNENHILFLPRLQSQVDSLKSIKSKNFEIATKTYSGPDLLYSADAVISGGGTMNRESAILGTKTYSLFKGRASAVDDYLVNMGRMIRIQDEDAIPKKFTDQSWRKPEILEGLSLREYIVKCIKNV